MILIRETEEALANIYKLDEIKCPMHLSTGSESVSAVLCQALKETDLLLGAHRSHGIYLAKGGNLDKFMLELFGKEDGCCGGRGGSMHLFAPEVGILGTTPILGATIPIAVGSALASKTLSDKKVTAAFFGDGATDEGVFYESLNLASLYKLPILFFCENNNYSIFQTFDKRTLSNNIAERGKIFGVEGYKFFDTDLLFFYKKLIEIIETVRQGNPVIVEVRTHRWRQHVGDKYDYEIGFGEKSTLDRLKTDHDPIKLLKKYLIDKKILSNRMFDELVKNTKYRISLSIELARKARYPAVNR